VNRTGLVLAREGSHFRVHTAEGEITAVLRGRIKRDDSRALVGDRVTLEQSAGDWAIATVAERVNLLERRIPGGRGTRPIAANLDQIFVMTAAADPEPIPQLLDRLLVLAESNDISAAVIVNKIDRASGAGLIKRFEQVGYPVFPISVTTGAGLAPLLATLHSEVSLVTGASGVGKSSLLNVLQPGLTLRTGVVSQKEGRGRHTTVTAEMLPLDGGGYLVDTPGFSDVGFWGLEPRGLVQCFPDLQRHAEECRFPDCTHRTEPGCGVRAAVGSGVAEDRYQSFLTFLDELNTELKDWE
jgi:ribosome biogenesis GTPase